MTEQFSRPTFSTNSNVFDTEVFEKKGGRSNPGDDLSSKLAREGELFGSLPSHLKSGFAERLQDMDLKSVASTVTEGVLIGGAIAMALKNPNALGGMGKFIAEHPKTIAATGIGADLVSRVAAPALDTWSNPNNLEADKSALGYRVASIATDYPLMGIGGALGAHVVTSGLAEKSVGVLRSLSESMVPSMRPAYAIAADARIPTTVFNRPLDMSALELNRPSILKSEAVQMPGEPAKPPEPVVTKALEDLHADERSSVKDLVNENMTLAHARAIDKTVFGKMKGTVLGDGGESLVIDVGDPHGVLKITDPINAEIEPRPLQWFDAKRWNEDERGGLQIYMQERLTPDASMSELDDFVKSVEKSRKWLFTDAKPSQLGRRADGTLRLMDTTAVRERTADTERQLLDDHFSGMQDFRAHEEDPTSRLLNDLMSQRSRAIRPRR